MKLKDIIEGDIVDFAARRAIPKRKEVNFQDDSAQMEEPHNASPKLRKQEQYKTNTIKMAIEDEVNSFIKERDLTNHINDWNIDTSTGKNFFDGSSTVGVRAFVSPYPADEGDPFIERMLDQVKKFITTAVIRAFGTLAKGFQYQGKGIKIFLNY